MLKGRGWARPLLLFITASSCMMRLGVATGNGADSDSTEAEGVVEQYLLAREAVEYELEDFYETAAPGDEPDLNSEAMENLRFAREHLYKAKLSAKDMADLMEGDPGLTIEQTSGKSLKRNRRSIRKRSIEIKPSRRWTKATVPYVFTETTDVAGQIEIIRSMRTFERFTCMRYVPWEETGGRTINTKLGLGHESYLTFVKGGGCWSFQGNIRKSVGGQKISCCGGVTCIHEIGHAMGEAHEHQSPNPDRNRMIRINFDGVEESKRGSYTQNSGTHIKSVGYDMSSYMHYAPWSFAVKGKKTFYKLFPELPHKNSYYYLMREVSLEHNCQDRCRDTPLTCENDGYLTLVDDKCSCKCIPGLDPSTGCTSVFQKDPEGIDFPEGQYAFPAHSSGCPDESFRLGSRTQINDGGNLKRKPFSTGVEVSEKKVEHKFCTKDLQSEDIIWPGANFCLYRRGGACPRGFTEGFIQFNDAPTNTTPNAQSGEMPDGTFGDDTRFEYCCSDTGFSSDELLLPSRKPFSLIKRRKQNCPKVRGMHYEVNTLRIGHAKDGGVQAVGGDHPMYREDRRNPGYWTAYCSYTPAMINCGDIIELDYSNTEVTISSPDAPELECYWLVKAPEGERLQLDFNDFDVRGTFGSCIDDLEVRYVRPGQPGVTFCGRKWEKTTISINNTIHMRFSTHGDSPSRFTATIKLVRDADLCYEASDRGVTYDGDVSFTRDFEPCLPWHEVTHCEVHPFQTDKLSALLEGNKCRNPDEGTGFMPWCYTKAENCIRNYCDVCLVGKRYDRVDNCGELKAAGDCNIEQCAKTCADEYPQPKVPIKAIGVSCGAPGPAPDGSPVDVTKDSFAVGEAIKYQCEYGDTFRWKYCLTSGQWSAMGTACSECPEGFTLNPNYNKCYLFSNIKKSADDAAMFCQAKGAVLAFPETEEENVYLRSTGTSSIILGITDKVMEGKFTTAAGDPLNYSKWAEGEPNNYRGKEDCTEMRMDSDWYDLRCTRSTRHFVCQTKMTPLRDCLDFSDKCVSLFKLNPAMCKKFPDFAEEDCRYTCGFCGLENAPTCTVDTPGAADGAATTLTRGMSMEFYCEKGYTPFSGDAVRGCLADGSLTGTPLECLKDCPQGWSINIDTMHCYKMFNIPKNFSAAEADCEETQGTLATALDEKEQTFVSSLKGATEKIWLGLSDTTVEGKFRWANGLLLSYSNWKKGEPNDHGSFGEDCVQMDADGKWKDSNCNDHDLKYICKIPLEVFDEYSWFWSKMRTGISALENAFG
ncbi:hypothetical protein EGW08_020330 [Elysia chlorotica]|uniref:Metalloendopeptidase n=1 Tax=Elysia chlorotica TaxID=188477 RepID=A0A433SRR6_ELYCH|nr:hypothetical protein EGW08_020330 [Elysia chlorotica]